MSDPRAFYDALADLYHLVFEDWDHSMTRQGQVLAAVLRRWPEPRRLVLDASAGIGTQMLALALRGFKVVGSDVSIRALLRARRESQLRGVRSNLAAADIRTLPFRSGCADIALTCDNSLPHLLSLEEIRGAILELRRCVRPGGGVVISMRDYVRMPPGTREHRPHGEREWNGHRYLVEQEWEWHGETYTLTMRIQPVDGSPEAALELSTAYFAVGLDDVLGLMEDAGLSDVQRVDGLFYQPLLIGTVPPMAPARAASHFYP